MEKCRDLLKTVICPVRWENAHYGVKMYATALFYRYVQIMKKPG